MSETHASALAELAAGLQELNTLLAGEVAELRQAVSDSGVSLFKEDAALELP